jgi:hypothetical protein
VPRLRRHRRAGVEVRQAWSLARLLLCKVCQRCPCRTGACFPTRCDRRLPRPNSLSHVDAHSHRRSSSWTRPSRASHRSPSTWRRSAGDEPWLRSAAARLGDVARPVRQRPERRQRAICGHMTRRSARPAPPRAGCGRAGLVVGSCNVLPAVGPLPAGQDSRYRTSNAAQGLTHRHDAAGHKGGARRCGRCRLRGTAPGKLRAAARRGVHGRQRTFQLAPFSLAVYHAYN